MAPGDAFALIRRWQAFLEASGRANANTRRQYRRAFVAFLADVCLDPRDVTEDDAVAWIAERSRLQGSLRPDTIRAARSFYRWAAARGEVERDPFAALPVPRHKYGRAPYLSPAELARVLEAARAHRDPRVAPTIELAYATAARVSSLCAIEAADVDLDAGWITFRVVKGGGTHGVPLNDRARAAVLELIELADYTPVRGRRRPTLIGVGRSRVEQWVGEVERASGVRVWPHLIRHTILTELAHDPSVPFIVTSRIAGHSDPRVTAEAYVGDDENAMRSALAGR
jgi:integrase